MKNRDLIEYKSYLTPYNGINPIVARDPLEILAETHPNEVANILRGKLAVRRIRERNSTIRNVSRDMASEACTWLSQRQEGEKEMDIDFCSEVRGRTCFAEGEIVKASLRIRIR